MIADEKTINDLALFKGVISQKIDALLDQGRHDKANLLMEARGYINRALDCLRFGTKQMDLDAAGAYLERAKEIIKGAVE